MARNILTRYNDTDLYLFEFFDIATFFTYAQVSKECNQLINKYKTFRRLKKMRKNKPYGRWAINNGYVDVIYLLKKDNYDFENTYDYRIVYWFKKYGPTSDQIDYGISVAKTTAIEIMLDIMARIIAKIIVDVLKYIITSTIYIIIYIVINGSKRALKMK